MENTSTGPVVIPDEQWEAEFEKRMGAKPGEFIKKSEQAKVLTDAEKLEQEESERQEVVKFGLSNKLFTTTEHEEFIAANQANEVDLLRKKYVAEHPEDKDAANTFNLIYRVNEDDELVDGELTTPNVAKQKALDLLKKEKEEYIEKRFGKVKGAASDYGRYKEQQALISKNKELVTKAISQVPREVEIETPYGKIPFKFDAADFEAATQMVEKSGELRKGKIDVEEVQETVGMFLNGRRFNDIVAEITKVAVEKAVDDLERGKSGIEVKRGQPAAGVETQKEQFLKSVGIKI